eukprot:TRINITY_DN19095_c0_g1_i2.p3 TRINITY_DN19095_c0_g1~~TRINITY_DN19095_c0_g1_i2.p3  ORF type:complete len:213 (+),score=29.55 TRINITY_DN19095_c0_g1_i2:224-862(+)
MAVKKEIYKCNHCGNIVEVMHGAGGELVCCGEAMERMTEKAADSSTEKHVPLIEKIEGGYRVTVGSTLHPMLDEHYIEWIELNFDGKSCKKFLAPGTEPVAEFLCGSCEKVTAREYCNLHGLWKAQIPDPLYSWYWDIIKQLFKPQIEIKGIQGELLCRSMYVMFAVMFMTRKKVILITEQLQEQHKQTNKAKINEKKKKKKKKIPLSLIHL